MNNGRCSDYKIGNSTFRVQYKDITRLTTDALVSSDDSNLSMGGGVSASLLRAGGEIIAQEAFKHVPLKLGDVAVTSAGKLKSKYIFHVVTIDYENLSYASAETLASATSRCLQLSDALGVRSIAFPALGTGVAGVPFHVAAETMMRTIADYLHGDTRLELVTLALFARESVQQQDLNVFYERSVALATLATQSRRLGTLFDELSRLVSAQRQPELLSKIDELRQQLEHSQRVLVQHPETLEQLVRLQDQSGVADVAKQAVEVSGQVRAVAPWADKELDAQILRTKLTGLLTQLNIQTANLNRYQIEKAKYGGQLVPPRLETAIDDLTKEMTETESQVRETRAQLAGIVQN